MRLPARELVSEPVSPGAVQVTRDGQCVILGTDGQTIGGYPKVAQVIAADLDLVGQLRPGDRGYFEQIEKGGTEELYRRKRRALREWLVRLREGEVFAVPGRLLGGARDIGRHHMGDGPNSIQQGVQLVLGQWGDELARRHP